MSDGAGGVYVVWGEWRERPFTTLYIQHVTASGDVAPGWTSLGRKVTDVGADQYTAKITSDGNGGVIVAWEQFSSTLNEVRMQRIDAAGALLWGPAGVRIDIDAPAYLGNVLTDGSGGAFVSMWANFGIYPDFTNTVVLQHLTANGAVAPGWPQNGLQPTTAQYASPGPESLIPDGSGGVFTMWADNTGSATFMAQRITADGTSLWAPGGIDAADGRNPFRFRERRRTAREACSSRGAPSPRPTTFMRSDSTETVSRCGVPGSAVVCRRSWAPVRSPHRFRRRGRSVRRVDGLPIRPGHRLCHADEFVGIELSRLARQRQAGMPGVRRSLPYYSLPATLAGDGNGGTFMTWYFEVAWGLDIFAAAPRRNGGGRRRMASARHARGGAAGIGRVFAAPRGTRRQRRPGRHPA